MGRKISAGIKNIKTRLIRATIAAGLIAATAMPAAAQFQSHAYQFLKAVRDQDALKAKEFFDKQIGRAHAELQSLMRISYAVFCLKKKKQTLTKTTNPHLINKY